MTDLRTLVASVAFRFDKRAGFVTRDDMPSHYLDLADAVLAAVLPEHRRTVLEADRPQPCPLDHSCDDGEMCSCWCDLHDYPIAECPTFTLVERWIADMRTEHEAVVARLRRTVLTEAAGAIIRDALCNEGTPYDTLGGAVAVVRRLAAAAPPAGLSATVPAQNAPAVPEDYPFAQIGRQAVQSVFAFADALTKAYGPALSSLTKAYGTPPVPKEADGPPEGPEGPYRVGRKAGRTIYRMAGDQPSDEDVLIGVMDTRELAASAVRGMNEHDVLVAQVAHYQHHHERPDTHDDLEALRRRVESEQAEQRVVDKAKAWRAAHQRARDVKKGRGRLIADAFRELAAAVDALPAAGTDQAKDETDVHL